ncbi:hypothetical protein BDW69DRAFT_163312 [Aspergillus filifer]
MRCGSKIDSFSNILPNSFCLLLLFVVCFLSLDLTTPLLMLTWVYSLLTWWREWKTWI